jgi:AraC family cel operon transcriptional repressor
LSPVDVAPASPVRLSFRTFVRMPDACHFVARTMTAATLPAPHDHDFCEVFWIERGSGVHVVDGVSRPFGPGALVWVAARDRHAFETSPGPGYRLVNLAFEQDAWRELRDRYLGRDADPIARPPARRHLQLDRRGAAELQVIAAELVAGARARRALDRFLLNLLELAERRATGADERRAPEWLTRALSRLDDPEMLARGPRALAESSGKTPEHVAREARRWLGRTPTELVNERRLDRAAALLVEGDASVLDVALEVGHANFSHFYRLFRKRFGTSPGAYRALHRRVLTP